MPSNRFHTSDILNYGEISALFEGKPQEYAKVLKMVHEDFLNNYILIMESLSERNLEQFSKVYHNLRGNINLFDVHPLRELLNKIELNLQEETLKERQLNFSEELHKKFNLISQSLENKINELTNL